MAFVVAIAGIMLPAISGHDQLNVYTGGRDVIRLRSNFDLDSIPKTVDRRFALAATKSIVSMSSLSNVKIGGASPRVLSC